MTGILVARSLEVELRESALTANRIINSCTAGLGPTCSDPQAKRALARVVEIITAIYEDWEQNGNGPQIEVRRLIVAALNHREHVVHHLERNIPFEWGELIGNFPDKKVTLVTK